MTIRQTYKFYITHPTNGTVELFPINKKIEFKWTKDNKFGFFRKDLVTELVFKDDEFKLFYELDRSNLRCEKIEFTIIRKKQGDYLNFYDGYFALIDGDFDIDRCLLKIKPRIKDKYTPLLDNWDKEQDFIGGFGAPKPLTVKLFLGEVEEKTCEKKIYGSYSQREGNGDYIPPITDCLDFPGTWTVIKRSSESLGFENNQRVALQKDTFAREYILLDSGVNPPGDFWVNVGLVGNKVKWARPLQISIGEYKEKEFTNGRKLYDVFEYLLKFCNLKFKSDFLSGIQAINNTPYQYAFAQYKELIIFQKSDVRREIFYDNSDNELPHEPATKAIVKLKDFIDWLSTIFNLSFDIEVTDTESTLILEHITFFREKSHMIDLTTEENQFKIRGRHGYKYLKEEFTRSERWNWMEQSKQNDFDAPSISYENTCVFDGDGKDQEYSCGKITTNVSYIIKNKSQVSNDGFVIMSTDRGLLKSGIGIVSNVQLLNNPMTLSAILFNLHRHGRPHKIGMLNNNSTSFFDVKKKREGREITTPINEDDVFEFDPKLHKVKTQLNWGEVSAARLVDPESLLSFTLHHN